MLFIGHCYWLSAYAICLRGTGVITLPRQPCHAASLIRVTITLLRLRVIYILARAIYYGHAIIRHCIWRPAMRRRTQLHYAIRYFAWALWHCHVPWAHAFHSIFAEQPYYYAYICRYWILVPTLRLLFTPLLSLLVITPLLSTIYHILLQTYSHSHYAVIINIVYLFSPYCQVYYYRRRKFTVITLTLLLLFHCLLLHTQLISGLEVRYALWRAKRRLYYCLLLPEEYFVITGWRARLFVIVAPCYIMPVEHYTYYY